MAIVQVSRITHRKGLQQDLPQLSGAEFGWALDTRKLYIGNGTISEGAASEGVTEILTQYSDLLNIAGAYTFRGAQSGYTSQTGVSALAPVQRSLQLKVDDVVNSRDFGAVGDGTTNDTAALQRAIDQIYFGGFSLTQNRLRRVINIPAGVYIIDASIKLSSHVILRGEGKDRTVIVQTNAGVPVFQLKDGNNQIGTEYGQGGGALAVNITVENMTIQHQQTDELVYLDACSGVTFSGVKFRGSQLFPDSASLTQQNGLRALPREIIEGGATLGNVEDLVFYDCDFINCTQGLVLNAKNVRVIGCEFDELSNGVWIDSTLSTAEANNIKLMANTFKNVYRSGIKVVANDTDEPMHVTSTANHFAAAVGYEAGAVTPTYSPIDFNGASCISLGDTFERVDADSSVPRIAQTKIRNVSLQSNVGLTMGYSVIGMAQQFLVPYGSSGNSGVIMNSTPGSYMIDYLITRGETYRRGSVDVLINNAGSTLRIEYTDDYIEYPEPEDYYVQPGRTGTTISIDDDGSGNAVWWANVDGFTEDNATVTYRVTTIK